MEEKKQFLISSRLLTYYSVVNDEKIDRKRVFQAKDLKPLIIISETKETESDTGDGDDLGKGYISNSEEHTDDGNFFCNNCEE